MCTDSLVGNLSPWSVIANESSMPSDCEIGRDELGKEPKIYKFYC